MLKVSGSLFAIFLLLMLAPALLAQSAQPGSFATDKNQSRQVIGSASEKSVRFTSLGELIEMRVEVIGPMGDTVIETDFKPGNVIDWSISDIQAKRLVDGSYLCVVSVRDTSSFRLTRKHVIVIVHDQSLSLKQVEASSLTAAQAQAAGSISDEEHITIVDQPESSTTAVLAHDGTTTHLSSGSGGLSISSGDFFGKRAIEQVRLTTEGNVGIGITHPQARLDVDGLIRAAQGIVFPDGSVQFSAAKKTFGLDSLGPGQFTKNTASGQEHFQPQASGTGTQNFIAKWTDNAGTLGNSVIFESGGNLGIGTTNPQSGFDYRSSQAALFTRDLPANPVVPQSVAQLGVSNLGSRFAGIGASFLFFADNTAGAKSFLGRVSGVWENPTAGAEAGSIFFQVRANSADTTASTERMRITSSGNVGIGTSTPNRSITVQRNGSAFINMIDPTGPFEFLVGASTGGGVLSTMTNHDLQLRAGGNQTKMIIKADGNIGIGTTAPDSKLEVKDGEITSSGATGGRFAANNPNNQDARVLLDWFNDGTRDWPRIRYGGTGEGAVNGFLIQGPGNNSKLAIRNDGNVGIGTTSPTFQLSIVGSSSTNGGASFGILNEAASTNFFQTVNNLGQWQLRSGFTNYITAGLSTVGVPIVSVTQTLHAEKLSLFDLDTFVPAPFLLCHTGGEPAQTKQVGNCSSSIRYKKNVNPFSPGMDLIRRLRPVSFNWKGSDMPDFGLIAEEVAEVEPLLVTHNDAGQIQGVKYERLGVVLINALKEQHAQIEALQQTVSNLQRQNDRLSRRWRALYQTKRSNRRGGRK